MPNNDGRAVGKNASVTIDAAAQLTDIDASTIRHWSEVRALEIEHRGDMEVVRLDRVASLLSQSPHRVLKTETRNAALKDRLGGATLETLDVTDLQSWLVTASLLQGSASGTAAARGRDRPRRPVPAPLAHALSQVTRIPFRIGGAPSARENRTASRPSFTRVSNVSVVRHFPTRPDTSRLLNRSCPSPNTSMIRPNSFRPASSANSSRTRYRPLATVNRYPVIPNSLRPEHPVVGRPRDRVIGRPCGARAEPAEPQLGERSVADVARAVAERHRAAAHVHVPLVLRDEELDPDEKTPTLGSSVPIPTIARCSPATSPSNRPTR